MYISKDKNIYRSICFFKTETKIVSPKGDECQRRFALKTKSGFGVYQLRNAKRRFAQRIWKSNRRVVWKRKFQLIVVLVEVTLQLFLTDWRGSPTCQKYGSIFYHKGRWNLEYNHGKEPPTHGTSQFAKGDLPSRANRETHVNICSCFKRICSSKRPREFCQRRFAPKELSWTVEQPAIDRCVG